MLSSQIHNHILEAWKLTITAQRIRRFNFIGSLLDTLILSFTLTYQIGYVYLDIMDPEHIFFTWLLEATKESIGTNGAMIFGTVIFVALFYFLVNFLIKNVFNGGLIHLIRAYRNQNERQYRFMSALTFGWKKSVKLSEYQALLFWSKPVYIFTILFWGYRYLGQNYSLVIIIAIIFLCALFVTRFVFEYAKYYIITENLGVFEALGKSLTMTLENIEITARIFVSLIFVYIREVILLVGIFALPFIISWMVALGLGPIFLQGVFIVIGFVYLVFLIIVSAMNSVIEIFVESLWYSIFLDNLAADSDSHHEDHADHGGHGGHGGHDDHGGHGGHGGHDDHGGHTGH